MGSAQVRSPEVKEELQVWKEVVPNITRTANTVFRTSARKYLAMEQRWFNIYAGTELGKVFNCSIAPISDDYKSITGMGDSVVA